MKLKLLFTALLLFTLQGFSQATAYEVNDIVQCSMEVFDLTDNSPQILGDQDPDNYTVTFFYTQADADANVNAMQDPTFFVPNTQMATVYARVTNITTGDYDTTSFNVMWFETNITYNNHYVCGDQYVLDAPNEPGSQYFTGQNGTGTELFPGEIITETQMIYVYNQNEFGCISQTIFEVVIQPLPAVAQPSPILVCDTDNTDVLHVNYSSALYEIMNGQAGLGASVHYNEEDAYNGTNALPNPFFSQDSNSFTIYVRVMNTNTDCFVVVPVIVAEGPCTNNNFIGQVLYDMDANGCTPNDFGAAGIPVQYTVGATTVTTFTGATGEYAFTNLPDGTGIVSIAASNLYTAGPASQQVVFPGNMDEFDFCLIVTNPVNDVAVTIVPLTGARPGFATYYAMYYENNGSLPASGTITLQYDNANLYYNSSSPAMTHSGNTLTLSYSNLQPFQSGVITLAFTVMIPQVTPAGTILNFTAAINSVTGDANPDDNTYGFEQIVVNSWDPNDITVHEGEFVTEDETDNYLTYTIRFQNKGNANAVNVAIENPIHENLDLSTFELIGSSHDYTATVHEGSVLFEFNNINLTWEDNDEMASQGYVTYRIKPTSEVTLGDYMQGGSAGIFFDFNDPVLTNVVTTTVQNTMGVADFAADGFMIYPNPASGMITLQLADASVNAVNVVIADVLGKTVISRNLNISGAAADMDISALTGGIYLITITSEGKSVTKKVVVK